MPLLWHSGYLTIKDSKEGVFTLGFPNAEVRDAWFGMMLGHFCGSSSSGADGQTSAAIMLAAGGFEERAVQCLWEEVDS